MVGKRLRLIDAVELAKYTADSGPDLLAGAIRSHGRLLSPSRVSTGETLYRSRHRAECSRDREIKVADETTRNALITLRNSWINIANNSEVVGAVDANAVLEISQQSS